VRFTRHVVGKLSQQKQVDNSMAASVVAASVGSGVQRTQKESFMLSIPLRQSLMGLMLVTMASATTAAPSGAQAPHLYHESEHAPVVPFSTHHKSHPLKAVHFHKTP
jgi:hypothetical protein